jgi:hypothetical protein
MNILPRSRDMYYKEAHPLYYHHSDSETATVPVALLKVAIAARVRLPRALKSV